VRNDKKKQIMLAVEKLAAKKAIYEITLDEVAATAKIGKGTIYQYFKSKEDLFFEVAVSGFDELCELLRKAVPDNALFSVKFNNLCSHIIKFFASRRQLLQIMLTQSSCTCWPENRFRQIWTSKRKNLVKTVANILSEGVDEGQIRSDLSTDFLAAALLGIFRAYVRDSDASSDSTPKSELLTDLFLNGAYRDHNRLAVHCSPTLQDCK
jgi:AcrR family transcriptional regulator